jgi:nuclear transcription Y subunit beta
MTGGAALNSSGGAQETSPFDGSNNGGAVLGNTMEPTDAPSTNDYAYVAQGGAVGEY